MKLYEIDNAIYDCVNEDGEVIDPEKLEELQMERDKKIEGIACWIKELAAEANAIKEEKLRLEARQRVAENKVKSLKSYLAYALQGASFRTAKVSVSFRKTESVEVTPDGLENLMRGGRDDLLTYKQPEPNKTAIKNAIKNDGLNIAGIQLVQNVSTIIK